MNNSRLFRLSRIVIAFTAASGMMVNTAYATDEAKAATQYTQQINQNYAKSLPFSDRQDFDDAQRGFIAPLLDEGILRDANGKVYYRAGNDSNLLIVFYVQIMPDDLVMQLHRF